MGSGLLVLISGRCVVEHDGLALEVGGQALQAALTTHARLLESAETDAEVDTEAVLAHRARPEPACDPHGAVGVVREHRGVEAVDGVVRDPDGVLFVFGWITVSTGPKISSRPIVDELSTFAKTVGSM